MRNLWVWVVALIVIVGGGYWYWQSTQMSAMSMDMGTPTQQQVGATTTPVQAATVVYNGTSFSPSTVTIVQGGSVTYTSTAGSMWVASDPHPNHDGYDGNAQSVHCAAGYAGPTPFDECSAGTSFTFVFNKTSTWGYHDHLNDDVGGTVIVVAE